MASYPITHKYLLSILDYNPKTGIFTWRQRPLNHFKDQRACNIWNTRFSGKNAGSLTEGYIKIAIKNRKREYAHRLAYFYVTKKLPSYDIDHINGIKNDNRWINLRAATRTQNNGNSKIKKNNKTGYKGVIFDYERNKYRATISVNNKTICLGRFNTPQKAHAAYCKAAQELFGEFASFD